MPRNGRMSRSARRAHRIAPPSNQAAMFREAVELRTMGFDDEAIELEEGAPTVGSGALLTISTRCMRRSNAKCKKNGSQEALAKMNEYVPHSADAVVDRLRAKLDRMRLVSSDSNSEGTPGSAPEGI